MYLSDTWLYRWNERTKLQDSLQPREILTRSYNKSIIISLRVSSYRCRNVLWPVKALLILFCPAVLNVVSFIVGSCSLPIYPFSVSSAVISSFETVKIIIVSAESGCRKFFCNVIVGCNSESLHHVSAKYLHSAKQAGKCIWFLDCSS